MKEDYAILHSYILKFDFDSPASPVDYLNKTLKDKDCFANQSNEIKLSVEYQKDSGLFFVDLNVICNVWMNDDIDLFSIDVVYRGLVAVNFSLEENKLKECLRVRVPQELYGSLQDVIYSVTRYSGLPAIQLDAYSFKDNCLKENIG